MQVSFRALWERTFLFPGIAAIVCLQAGFGQSTPPRVYSWSPTGPLAIGRYSACVAALDDGRGLVAGGSGTAGALNSVELYQSDGSFLPGQPLLHSRSNHTCTVLNDGRVLAAGGKSADGAAPAEIYDPDADAWSDLDTPGLPRWNHSATLLPDGTVLLAGGDTASGASNGLEVFSPLTNRIELLAATLAVGRTGHAAAALADGRVLIVGGTDGSQLLSSIDVYHPDGTVTQELHLPEARAAHSATTLADGRILIAGGQSPDGDLRSALLFSPDDNVFHAAGPLGVARSRHLAILLPGNGGVLITGGDSAGTPTAASELFDSDAAVFTTAGPLTAARRNLSGAALNLPGEILVVGGLNDNGPLANCGSFLAPVLTLDKSTYVQGDNITVSGANWPSGKTLTINSVVRTFSGTPTIGSFNVTVTSSGSFVAANALPAPLGLATSGGLITFSTHITATVNGATVNFTASAGATQLDVTTTTLTTSSLKVLTLEKVKLTANVKLALPAMPLQGFVTFKDGKEVLGTASTAAAPAGTPGAPTPGSAFTFDVNGNNIFTIPDVALIAGARTPSAIFTPTSSVIRNSDGTTSVQVDKRPTVMTFTVTASNKNVAVGDTLTLSASVKPATSAAGIPLPSGPAEVFRDPVDSFIEVNLTPNSGSGTSAGSKSIVAGPAGTLSLLAGYQGDDIYLAAPIINNSLTIEKGQVTFTATPNPVTTTAGGLVNLTTRIQHVAAPGSPAIGTISVVNGPANFSGNNVTVSPDLNDGTAVSTPVQTFLQDAGSKTIQLHYSGDSNYLAADLSIPATVNKITPSLTVTNFLPVCCDLLVTFRVDVNPPGTLFLPKPPTGLFNSMAPSIEEPLNPGNCVINPNTIGHGSGCNPQMSLFMDTALLIGCSYSETFLFVYVGDSNYTSQMSTVTRTVPIHNNSGCP